MNSSSSDSRQNKHSNFSLKKLSELSYAFRELKPIA
jgi:hypothetical protein